MDETEFQHITEGNKQTKQVWRNFSSSVPPCQIDIAQNWTIPWHHSVGGKESSMWVPGYPSCAGCCMGNPFPSSNTQSAKAGPPWLRGGKKLESGKLEYQRIIKGHGLCWLSSGCLEKVPQASGRTSAKDLPTRQTSLIPQVLDPYLPSLPLLQLQDWPQKSGKLECYQKNRPGSVGRRETTNLNCSTTFWKKKERFPGASQVSCKIQRRHKSLRILPQEGARNVEQVYKNKVWENPIYNRTNKQYTPSER